MGRNCCKRREKNVYFILSCYLERPSKCNSCSLRDKQNGRFSFARPMAQMICCGKSPWLAWSEDMWRCSCVKMLMLGAHAAWKLFVSALSSLLHSLFFIGFYCCADGQLSSFSVRSYINLHLFDLALSRSVSSIKKSAPIIALVHRWWFSLILRFSRLHIRPVRN